MCGEKLQGHSSFVRIQCLICHGRSTCGGGREVEVVVLQLVVLSMCSRNKQGVLMVNVCITIVEQLGLASDRVEELNLSGTCRRRVGGRCWL